MARPTRGEVRLHLGLVVAEAICIPAFTIELLRARHGNLLSWAYVVEWPFLAGYGVYVWRRFLAQERGVAQQKSPAPLSHEETTRLAQWNDYLAAVHRDDANRGEPGP